MRSSQIRRLAGIAFTHSLFAGFVVSLLPAPAMAQQPARRIVQDIEPNVTAPLPGSVNPRIAAARDLGPLDSSTPMEGMTLWFQPTAAQKAELDALIEAQQTPGSPWYHVWLTPAQYAARFGLSDADLARVENWLTSQGFNVDRVANSHTSITFSGTAALVESAFQTQLHRYQTGAETHFANATDVAIPSALAGIVGAVRNLDDFRPRPQLRPSPAFTSAQSGSHFLTPKDIGTIYDLNAAWNAGYTGSGVTITVVGQTSILASDIAAFQSAAGLTVKAPTMTLVPNSGTATTPVQGDEAESDLDLEYAGGIAPGATIDFVYAGKSQNVFNALQYAVDNKIGQIINISYGACESTISSSTFSSLEGVMQQAAAQGQTVVAASGDEGSTACYNPTNNTVTASMEALAVNYPASSAYAVGVGGTEFPQADAASGNTNYWQSASGSDVVSSAVSYIPETSWNDDSSSAGTTYGAQYALSAGGGGVSTLTPRPGWQTGVPGIPSGSFRLVPDISLASSPNYVPYLYCSSDTSAWSKTQVASCNSGFRDSSSKNLTVAGGTSFASPIFAGMLAIIEQRIGSSGLGVASHTLYSLASNASTYASAFHDITSGGNQCTAGASYCSSSGAAQYAATAGYDEATGLGSVDFSNLMTAWAGSSTGGGGGGTGGASIKLAATNISVAQGNSGTSTVTVVPQNSYAGTVALTATSTGSLANYGCYTIGNATVGGASASATLTVYTSQTACSGLSGAHALTAHPSPGITTASNQPPFSGTLPAGAAALAGLLFLGFSRFRKASALLSCLALAAMIGFAAGCGSSSGSSASSSSTGSTSTQVTKGSYTVTVTGTDTANSSISASTTLTVAVN
jgi:subtilase family serine protease